MLQPYSLFDRRAGGVQGSKPDFDTTNGTHPQSLDSTGTKSRGATIEGYGAK